MDRLDERTRAKIDFVSAGRPEEARQRLEQLAEPSQLPQQYGGTGPPLADWPERSGIPPAVGRLSSLMTPVKPPRDGEGAQGDSEKPPGQEGVSPVPYHVIDNTDL